MPKTKIKIFELLAADGFLAENNNYYFLEDEVIYYARQGKDEKIKSNFNRIHKGGLITIADLLKNGFDVKKIKEEFYV